MGDGGRGMVTARLREEFRDPILAAQPSHCRIGVCLSTGGKRGRGKLGLSMGRGEDGGPITIQSSPLSPSELCLGRGQERAREGL
jgi:hypothetical protein